MSDNRVLKILISAAILGIAFYLVIWPSLPDFQSSLDGDRTAKSAEEGFPLPDLERSSSGRIGNDYLDYEELLAILLRHQLEQAYALENEGILRFNSEAAYRRFLGDALPGVRVVASIDRLRAVRLKFDSYDDLASALARYRDDYDATPNYLVSYPGGAGSSPVPANPEAVGFGPNAPRWLGIDTDNSAWGQGVRVAVLDSGVVDHVTFKNPLIQKDMLADLYTTTEVTTDGHGTAMASVIAGSSPTAPGIAPDTSILSYRVLDSEGVGDTFTLVEGLYQALDDGAQIFNLSLGSQGNSPLLEEAINEIYSRGGVLIAAAGNDGIDSLSYPAAYENVISTGTIDANSIHLNFSNTGEGLDLTAPGYEINAAWLDDGYVVVNGTSPSTGIVSGAVSAMLSQNPGLTAQAAAQVLLRNTNDAGAPGPDSVFGIGVLDVGRAMNENTPGIYDVALAGHYYNPAEQAPTNTQMMSVVVQNRGTETIHLAQLEVNTVSGLQSFDIQNLAPGAIAVRQVPINSVNLNVLGEVSFTSSVSILNQTDSTPSDNAYQSTYSNQESTSGSVTAPDANTPGPP